MKNKKQMQIIDPVEYFKDVARIKEQIRQLLFAFGLTMTDTDFADIDVLPDMEPIEPNGAIGVLFENNLPAGIKTPFGLLYLKNAIYYKAPFKKKTNATNDEDPIAGFNKSFEKMFCTEIFKYKRLLKPFDIVAEPEYCIKRLPWKWQYRLPNCRSAKSSHTLSKQKLEQLLNEVNESFIKNGTPEYCFNANLEFYPDETQK